MRRHIERLKNGNLRVTVGFCFRNRSNSRKIVSGDGEDGQMATSDTMMIAIARGHRWQRCIDEGKFKNGTELARAAPSGGSRARWPGRCGWRCSRPTSSTGFSRATSPRTSR